MKDMEKVHLQPSANLSIGFTRNQYLDNN